MNRRAKLSSLVALSLLLLAVLACSRGGSKDFEIPADKQDYIGDWSGQFEDGSMRLSIAADGTVNYERKKGSSTKSISSGKITKFDGNDFEVKAFVVSTTFKVEKPPYRDGNRWKMVVDGMEVSRKDATEVSINIAEMRKDDGNGKPSNEATDTYTPSDKAIHSFVRLDNPKAGTRMRIVTIAVDAGPLKNEVIGDSNLITKTDTEDVTRSKITADEPLPRGDYKVDIYINDKLAGSVPFKVI